MKKILYMMGIDWYWIKQRPQIFAEMLNEDYEVTVVYPKEVFQHISLRKDQDELHDSKAVAAIPYRDKLQSAFFVQKMLYRLKIHDYDRYDIIWIGHPLLYRYLPPKVAAKIVYDCMDNHVALCNDNRIKKVIRKTERDLIHRADLILASSNGLRQKIKQIDSKKQVELVRNGFKKEEVLFYEKNEKKNSWKIGYIGTIAEWFDFQLLEASLKKFSNIEYFLWGPLAVSKPQEHSKIHFKGVLEHKDIAKAVAEMDGLIMPFKVNSIIEDVDPVKLYEYINIGKAIIVPYYKEIERFRPFVSFYQDHESFFEVLRKLQEDEFQPIYTEKEKNDFLDNNTWQCRYTQIKEYLNTL